MWTDIWHILQQKSGGDVIWQLCCRGESIFTGLRFYLGYIQSCWKQIFPSTMIFVVILDQLAKAPIYIFICGLWSGWQFKHMITCIHIPRIQNFITRAFKTLEIRDISDKDKGRRRGHCCPLPPVNKPIFFHGYFINKSKFLVFAVHFLFCTSGVMNTRWLELWPF